MGTIDTGLLRAAVESVEEGLRDMRRAMPPRKKAELVEAAYLLLLEERYDHAREQTVLARAAWDVDAQEIQYEYKAALVQLMELAHGHSDRSKSVAAFLLGLYNGERFHFDLTQLRTLDACTMEACLQVLRMDYHFKLEVHECFDDGSHRFEQLAKAWHIEDRAPKRRASPDAARPSIPPSSTHRTFHHNPSPRLEDLI